MNLSTGRGRLWRRMGACHTFTKGLALCSAGLLFLYLTCRLVITSEVASGLRIVLSAAPAPKHFFYSAAQGSSSPFRAAHNLQRNKQWDLGALQEQQCWERTSPRQGGIHLNLSCEVDGQQLLERQLSVSTMLRTLMGQKDFAREYAQQHPEVVRKVLRAALYASLGIEMGSSHADESVATKDVWFFAHHTLKFIAGSDRVLSCVQNMASLRSAPGVPTGRNAWKLLDSARTFSCGSASGNAVCGAQQLAVVLVLKNNSVAMPNLIVQLLFLALHLPPRSLFVSIYESESGDSTREWLCLLHMLLHLVSVDHELVLDGVMREGAPRVQHLARLRNLALQPVLDRQCRSAKCDPTGSGCVANNLYNSQSGQEQRRQQQQAKSATAASASCFHFHKIAFANDVFFCASDVLRLASLEAELSCGLDFHLPRLQRLNRTEKSLSDIFTGIRDIFPNESNVQTPDVQADSLKASQQMARKVRMLRFYDLWVARDYQGQRFRSAHPYVQHGDSVKLLSNGRPFPVMCCWNGLALMSASIFDSGLRFRSWMPEECRASECSLLCDDIQRQNRSSRIVADPTVRVAYDLEVAQLFDWQNAGKAFQLTSNSDVHREIKNWGPLPHYRDCCELMPGRDRVFFRKHCRSRSILEHNYTEDFLLGKPVATS